MATLTNASIIQFPAPSAAWLQPTHVGIAEGGDFYGSTAVTNDVAVPAVGADVNIAAGAITIIIPNGKLTNAGSREAVEALVDSDLVVSLHSGSPGATGANKLSGGGYTDITVATSGWTYSA